MIDEMTTSYMEPAMGQHGLQNLSRRGSWNPVSSPSSPLSRVTPPTPTGSRLGAYTMPLYVSASPKTFRKNNEIFDINDTDKHEIRLAFELFDTRKVGRLGYRELKVAMRALECDVKKAEVLALMQKYSKDDNNEIGSNEFMQIMQVMRKYKEKDPELNIGKIYAVFDEEGKGKISVKNVRKVARDLGEVFTDEQLEAMISECEFSSLWHLLTVTLKPEPIEHPSRKINTELKTVKVEASEPVRDQFQSPMQAPISTLALKHAIVMNMTSLALLQVVRDEAHLKLTRMEMVKVIPKQARPWGITAGYDLPSYDNGEGVTQEEFYDIMRRHEAPDG